MSRQRIIDPKDPSLSVSPAESFVKVSHAGRLTNASTALRRTPSATTDAEDLQAQVDAMWDNISQRDG